MQSKIITQTKNREKAMSILGLTKKEEKQVNKEIMNYGK